MFRLINRMFAVLLTGIVNASNHAKFVCLSNQKLMNQFNLINIRPKEYTRGLCYYPFAVHSYRLLKV